MKKNEILDNQLEASQVGLLNEYQKLCQTWQKEKGCYQYADNCYSCELHFKMTPLISKLKLYEMEVRE